MRGSSGIRRTRLSTSDFPDTMNKWDVMKHVPPRLEVSAVAKRTKKATTKTRRHKSAANTNAPLGPGPGKRALRGKLGRISRNHTRRSAWIQAAAAAAV